MKNYKNFSITTEEKLLYESWQNSDRINPKIKNRVRIILLISKGIKTYDVAQTCGISCTNIYKWLSRYEPNNHDWFIDRSRQPKHSPSKTPDEIERTILFIHSNLRGSGYQSGAKSIVCELKKLSIKQIPSTSTINRILKMHDLQKKRLPTLKSEHKPKMSSSKGKGQRLIKRTKRENRRVIFLTTDEKKILKFWVQSTMIKAGISKRSEIILLLAEGKSFSEVAKIMRVSRTMVHKWANRFLIKRTEGLRRKKSNILKKHENETIKEVIFALLHSPPLDYGINRTSWKLDDLKKCLSEKGTFISKGYIRKIIKNAGYSWRKAKIILTSTDPDYREKLNKIQSILCNLKNDECFFSIDEFGPVSIKMRGGIKLSAPGEYPSIPQYQKPKGYLIVTAALELSTNQVTHFYSKTKNTAEMIKLLDIILMEYQTCRTIYLSWDAARWHASKAFFKHVDLINDRSLSSNHSTPIIKLAPLPKSAQFLNVIESVFSGLARAIIHNSDYSSVEECMIAIDSYFRERNLNFKKNPKKAGKKIWGNELVPAKFKEGQNCKNPRWR